MINHLFVLNTTEKFMTTISSDNTYYIRYNNYLQQYYEETIESNEDFIPMDIDGTIILILARYKSDDPIEAEDVFEVMQDKLYIRV